MQKALCRALCACHCTTKDVLIAFKNVSGRGAVSEADVLLQFQYRHEREEADIEMQHV